MRRTLIIAILLPIVAYLPIMTGGFLPVWLNVGVFVGCLTAAIISTSSHVIHIHSTSSVQLRTLLRVSGFVLYGVVLFAIADLLLVLFASYSIIYGASTGSLDLTTFVFYSFFVIPVCYIVGTYLLLSSTNKSKNTKKQIKRK